MRPDQVPDPLLTWQQAKTHRSELLVSLGQGIIHWLSWAERVKDWLYWGREDR